MSRERTPAICVLDDEINKLNSPAALGVYVYMTYLLSLNKKHDFREQIKSKFNLNDEEVTKIFEILDKSKSFIYQN